jgi:hypothetical protein
MLPLFGLVRLAVRERLLDVAGLHVFAVEVADRGERSPGLAPTRYRQIAPTRA